MASVVMLVIMNSTLLSSLLVTALACTFSVSAALYKGLDSEGKVVFSDRPFKDAQKLELPPISVVSSSDSSSEKEVLAEEKAAVFQYMSFDIVSPINNQIIRTDSDISVSLNLRPGINTEKNHSIWLLVDGKAQISESQDLSLQLGRLNRGAHELQAQIRSPDGEIIVRTKTSVVYIRPSSTR